MNWFNTVVGVASGISCIIAFLKLFILPVRNFIKKSNENDEKLTKALEKLSEKVDNNERDRLREEIFAYGNKARNNKKISGEEFRHLQEVFDKYSTQLKGNGIAKQEFDFIVDYYNKQSL